MYFIYPETRGVRLEEMDVLFDDASTASGRKTGVAETGLLAGIDPSGAHGHRAEPGLIAPSARLDPSLDPAEADPLDHSQTSAGSGSGGIWNWVSWMVKRRSGREGGSDGARYAPLGQLDE